MTATAPQPPESGPDRGEAGRAALTDLPLTALADLLRAREVSAREVVRAHLDRIEACDASLNAVVTLAGEQALAAAAEADAEAANGHFRGPLHGVPFTVKDALATAGVRTTCAFERLADHVPDVDAEAVRLVRAAGGILLGKTNLPKLTRDYQTFNELFGRTNNPWHLGYTAGGSSGGGAAAVAARMSPLDLGSDLTGSLRIPAHFCGVWTWKPTAGTVPLQGHIPELPGRPPGLHYLNVVGPLTRTPADLGLVMPVLRGRGRGRDHPGRRPRSIGLQLAPGGLGVERETADALQRLGAALASAGCEVTLLDDGGYPFCEAWELWGELFALEYATSMPWEHPDEFTGRPDPEAEEPRRRGFARMWPPTMAKQAAALAHRDRLVARWERLTAGVEVVLCPVAPIGAFRHQPAGEDVTVDGRARPYWTLGLGCSPFNVMGNPVLAGPMALAGDGLPRGVQIVGERGGDAALVGAAELVAEVAGPLGRPTFRHS